MQGLIWETSHYHVNNITKNTNRTLKYMHTIEWKPIIMKTKQWNLNAKFHFNLKTSTNFEKHNFLDKYISIWFCFCIIANICMYILKKIKKINREKPERNEEGGNSCVNDRGIVVPTQELRFLSVFWLLCFALFSSLSVWKSQWKSGNKFQRGMKMKREKERERHAETHKHKRKSPLIWYPICLFT